MSKKFIDLANLKSNLENFLSEIITPTFATKEGVSKQLGNHTVKSDVPENAVFTDTVYDYSALLGYDIYNLVSLKDATYPANKTWLSIDFIAPFDGFVFFMVQTDATSGAFTQVLREDNVLVSDNQKNIADFNTWGEAYRHQIYKGKTYHFGSYNNTATAFNKVMLCIRKKLETPTEYVPYAPSNVALAEKTMNLDNRISDNGYGEVAGGKNLIPDENMNKLLSQMSDNSDGTMHSYSDGVLSINRTANVNSGVYVYSSIFKRFDNKKIKISFDAKCSVSGMVLSIFLNNSAYSYTPILTSEYKRYSVEVAAGDTAHNFIIYGNAVAGEVNIKNIMFSEAVYNDTSYEPYFPSNKMLAEENTQQSTEMMDIKREQTTNMLSVEAQTLTSNDITCRIYATGSCYLSGTATSDTTFKLWGSYFDGADYNYRKYKVVGAPKGASESTFCLQLTNEDAVNKIIGSDYGNGFTFIPSEDIVAPTPEPGLPPAEIGRSYVTILVKSGQTLKNVQFKPMVTTNLNATYDDFVPYTGDNGKLNSDVADITRDVVTINSDVADIKSIYSSNSVNLGRKTNSITGEKSSTFGESLIASGYASHAEGTDTTASGDSSHTEGNGTSATGDFSHAEGDFTTTSGESSHAEGESTIANGNCQHVQGKYNIADETSAFIIGNGTDDTARSNAMKVDWNGNLEVAGNLKDGSGNTLKNMMSKTNPTGTGSFSLNRKAGTTIGTNSFAEGNNTTASGNFSHAEGQSTTASASYTHSEGVNTSAIGQGSHAEGSNLEFSERHQAIIFEDPRRVEVYDRNTDNFISITVTGSQAFGLNSHAEGCSTLAYGKNSHTEGYHTVADANESHAEGCGCAANAPFAHAEGQDAIASGSGAHAEGLGTLASGTYSHAEGFSSKASGKYSHAEGYYTKATNYASHASGKYNAAMTTGGDSSNTTGTAFVIGNGTSPSALSNAFSVQFDGTVKAKSTITASTTADYAEFFEWLDKNPNEEDRVGHFVTLDGDKIKIATNEDDYILGIVSGEPFVLGNGDCDTWNGMFLHDEFRRTMYEPAPKMIEILDSEGNPTGKYEEVEGEYEGTRPVLNPEYDPTQEYISRFDRTEWSPVGMLGVLAVLHDGTAEVNGYVTVNDEGIATKCTRDTRNSYRVIKKVSDKVVEVIFR